MTRNEALRLASKVYFDGVDAALKRHGGTGCVPITVLMDEVRDAIADALMAVERDAAKPPPQAADIRQSSLSLSAVSSGTFARIEQVSEQASRTFHKLLQILRTHGHFPRPAAAIFRQLNRQLNRQAGGARHDD